jgi:hypothetical protein
VEQQLNIVEGELEMLEVVMVIVKEAVQLEHVVHVLVFVDIQLNIVGGQMEMEM